MSRHKLPRISAGDLVLEAGSRRLAGEMISVTILLVVLLVGAATHVLFEWSGVAILATFMVVGAMFRWRALVQRTGDASVRADRRAARGHIAVGRRGGARG